MGSSLVSKESNSIVLGCSGVGWSHTGDTSETILTTVTVPPLGVNDSIEVFAFAAANAASANAKTLGIRIHTLSQISGSSLLEGLNIAPNLQISNYCCTQVRSLASNVNVGHPSTSACFGVSSGTTLVNTTSTAGNTFIIFTATVAVNTDTMTLKRYLVRLSRGK